MNKKIILGIALISFAGLYSCGGNNEANDETTDADSTAVVEVDPVIEEETEEETPLAFDGVEKSGYILYGHTEIDADGNEVSASEMVSSIEETGGFEGEIAVTISEVCQKAGCWITFENGDNEPVRVFFRDHFTIPTETAAGTEAILLGVAVLDTLSVDFQKHLLDDAADSGEEVSQEQYDAITEEAYETTFDCEAILVKTAE